MDGVKVKDVKWDKRSCIYAWDTIGIWLPEFKETDITSISLSQDEKLIAVGDNLGKVRVLQYPSFVPRSSALYLDGHANHVTSCLFTLDNEFLVTTGEHDCGLLFWKYKIETVEENEDEMLNIMISKKSPERVAGAVIEGGGGLYSDIRVSS